MKKPLRTAVIGVGNMGASHARVYSEISNLVATCDINQTLGEKIATRYQSKFYKDYREMLSKEKIDALSVVVPTIYHKQVAIECLLHRVPVLVEKPLSQTTQAAKEIIKIADKTKTLLTIGHLERFNPAVIKLKELINQGVFGQIVSIVIKRVGLYPPQVKDVNVITDLAVHDLDIVCNLIDRLPVSIYATGGNGLNNSHIDYADILLDFNNVSCYLQVNWITPIKIRTLSVTGTLGYGELDYITQELTLYKSSLKSSIPQKFENFITKFGQPKKIPIIIKKEEPLKLELIHFLESVSKKQNPIVTGEQGMRAVRLSEIILKSIVNKKIISPSKD